MTNARPHEIGTGDALNMPGGHGQATANSLSRLLRDEGVARANGNVDLWWRSCVDAAIAHLATSGLPFGADDVAALVPAPDKPCRWGGAFYAAVRAGTIRQVGYKLSTRPSRHSGVQRLYRGGAAR